MKKRFTLNVSSAVVSVPMAYFDCSFGSFKGDFETGRFMAFEEILHNPCGLIFADFIVLIKDGHFQALVKKSRHEIGIPILHGSAQIGRNCLSHQRHQEQNVDQKNCY